MAAVEPDFRPAGKVAASGPRVNFCNRPGQRTVARAWAVASGRGQSVATSGRQAVHKMGGGEGGAGVEILWPPASAGAGKSWVWSSQVK